MGRPLLNVGWLGEGQPFPTGETTVEFRQKLLDFCRDERAVLLGHGFHTCELCAPWRGRWPGVLPDLGEAWEWVGCEGGFAGLAVVEEEGGFEGVGSEAGSVGEFVLGVDFGEGGAAEGVVGGEFLADEGHGVARAGEAAPGEDGAIFLLGLDDVGAAGVIEDENMGLATSGAPGNDEEIWSRTSSSKGVPRSSGGRIEAGSLSTARKV